VARLGRQWGGCRAV
jgi:hypothetical protein